MRVVGIDSHKATLAACAVDEVGQPLAEVTFANDSRGFRALLAWLDELGGVDRIGLEGSAGFRRRSRAFPAREWSAGRRGPTPAQPS
jgi:hypothetical protein